MLPYSSYFIDIRSEIEVQVEVENELLQNKEVVSKGLCYQNLHFILLMLPLTHLELCFSQFYKKIS